MIVFDASVLVKLFKGEPESDIARQMVDSLVGGDETFLAPSVILYEALSAALHVDLDLATVHGLLAQLRRFGLKIIDPGESDIVLAEKIAKQEAPGGGYPTLFDSIYHAIAIERGGTFVTADSRHVAKTSHLNHVMLLSDWQPA